MYLLLETPRDNLLFRSPVDNPKYILDVGTGSGTWALDAAEKFPNGLLLITPTSGGVLAITTDIVMQQPSSA